MEREKKPSSQHMAKPWSPTERLALARELQEAQGVDELTEALRKVDKSFLAWDRKQEMPVLISVGTLAGLHSRRVPKCAEMLAETGIPVGIAHRRVRNFYDSDVVRTWRYYFIRSQDVQEALAVLKEKGVI